MPIRLAINRTCAPQYSLGAFIALASAVGVQAVEIRNDIDGREFADGTPAKELRARLDDSGLAVASVNALQRFNEWTDERAKAAEALIAYAAQLGAPGLVLCPVHNAGHGWSAAEAERNLRHGLRKLRPILRDHGVIGYVEPLGMTHSTMKRQDMAVAAISDCDGWDAYQLCYDTFQFFRCGDTRVFPAHVGLVHLSGIVRPIWPQEIWSNLTEVWSSVRTGSATSQRSRQSRRPATRVTFRWSRSTPSFNRIPIWRSV